MPFAPRKAPIATLLWLARRSAEDGCDAWWQVEGNYGLTPRVVALMDKAWREATADTEESTRLALTKEERERHLT